MMRSTLFALLALIAASPALGEYHRGTSKAIHFTLVDATDGSLVTSGTPVIYVLKDAGTPAVATNAAVYEGNNLWSWTPTTTEADATSFAALVTETGSQPREIQVFTSRLPDAVSGAAGGVFIAGTNAATTVNLTGNLSGSVGSVTGAVGSVTGNVGGNVVGSVGSISGITFPSNFAALGINASGHVSRVTLADTITTYTGNTPQTGDSFARIGATGSGLTSLATQTSVNDVITLQDSLSNSLSDVADGVADTLTAVVEIPTNAELATALDPLPTAAENAAAVIGATAAGSAGTVGKILADYAAVKPATTIAAADDVEAGADFTDVDQEPAGDDRTIVLVADDDEGLVGEKVKAFAVGTTPTFAVDFRKNMAVNSWITIVDEPTIVSGTAGGITFGTRGRDKSLAKFRATGVTAGTYRVRVDVTYYGGATATGFITLKVTE